MAGIEEQFGLIKKFIDKVNSPETIKYLSKWGFTEAESLETKTNFLTILEAVPHLSENALTLIIQKLNQIINDASFSQFLMFDPAASDSSSKGKKQAESIANTLNSVVLTLLKHLLININVSKMKTLNIDIKHQTEKYKKALSSNKSELTKKLNDSIENFNKSTGARLVEFTQQAEKLIKNAELVSQNKIQEANKTVLNISVKEAQDQFGEAKKQNEKQLWVWGIMSGVSLVAILGVFLWFYIDSNSSGLGFSWSPRTVYQTIFRLGLISLLTSILVFGLKMSRSQLHLREHNMHRGRVANSMAAFIESANEVDQRDKILMNLVNSIADFGSSGLISQSGKSEGNTISIDHITKGFKSINGD